MENKSTVESPLKPLHIPPPHESWMSGEIESYFNSSDMKRLGRILKHEYTKYEIYPHPDDIFRAMRKEMRYTYLSILLFISEKAEQTQ